MGSASTWASTGTQASLIAFAAIWGTLAREGLNAVASFDGQPLAEPVLWAQAVGCLVMGWAAVNKDTLDRPRAVQLSRMGVDLVGNGVRHGKTLPTLGVHVAITTGFCGSVTTFSTWILQDFLAFSNHGLYHRSGFFSFVDGVTQLFLTPVVSLLCLRAGMLAGTTWLSLHNILAFCNNPVARLRKVLHLEPPQRPPQAEAEPAPARNSASPPPPPAPAVIRPVMSRDTHSSAQARADEAADEYGSIISQRTSATSPREPRITPRILRASAQGSSAQAHAASEAALSDTAGLPPAQPGRSSTKEGDALSRTFSQHGQAEEGELGDENDQGWHDVSTVTNWWARITTLLAFLLGPAFWIGSGLLLALYNHHRWRHVTWALLFAPVGALLRWQLSVWCNPIPPPSEILLSGQLPKGRAWRKHMYKMWRHKLAWPVGTVIANVLATVVLAGVYTAQHIDAHAPEARTREMAHKSAAWGPPASSFSLGCGALYGVQEGFCACLSTISTFSVELNTMRPRRKAVLYAMASWAISMLFCVLLIGVPTWVFDAQGKTAYGPTRCPSLKY